MSNSFTVNVGNGQRRLSVRTGEYVHGKLAVQLIDESDGELYATVSLNLPGVRLDEGEFIFKTYSENEGLFESMLAAGIVEKTGRYILLGFGEPLPFCRLVER